MFILPPSQHVFIPKDVANLCSHISFQNCRDIDSIEVEKGNPYFYSENNCLIDLQKSTLILGCKNSIIPPSVKCIDVNAFQGCDFVSIAIPSTVERIKGFAFNCCKNLRSIVLPENLTKIDSGTFNGCVSLSSIEFSPNIVAIGDSAFGGCESLTTVSLPDSIKKIAGRAFENCINLETVKLPSSLTKISAKMFSGCKSLKKIDIPESVNFISHAAFAGCESLESIDLPPHIQKISCSTFRGCSGLSSIKIPYGVKEIRSDAFYECKNLKKIYIPSSVNKIIQFSFPYASGESIVIYGTKGSFAEKYARKNENYLFEEIIEKDIIPLNCLVCGTELVRNGKFCHQCGTRINKI